MEEIVLFCMSFIFIFLLYQFFIVRPAKKNYKNKKEKQPAEVKYLISRYKLDMKKVNYYQLLQIVALTSSFDISLICSLIMITNNFILRLLVGIISIILTILISYHLVYLFYKKKGMIKK